MKIRHLIFTIFTIVITIVLLIITIRGKAGNPIYYQTEHDTQMGGPFEASNSTSRYALTEAIVKYKTFLLNPALAKFSSPDVIINRGNYISIFTPGVSFIGIPFYVLGEKFGMPQLFTYLSIFLISILNAFLIAKLSRKLGAEYYTSLLSGLIFLFATNALPYSQTFTQHQASVLIILLSFQTLFGPRTWIKNIMLGMLFGAGILIDVPNAFFLLPVLIYVLIKHFNLRFNPKKITIFFKLNILAFIIGIIPFIALFGIYNNITTGSYLKLAQTGGQRYSSTLENKKTVTTSNTSKGTFFLPFNPRYQINSFYTLLVSNERAWIYYSPILFLGIPGIFILYKTKKNHNITIVLVSVILINIIVYSMFSDPWGGWAFGPRYLIPSAAILCIFISMAIERYNKNIFFAVMLFVLTAYSVFISSLGALTTTSIPPKQEAEHLLAPIPYTYQYNLDLLDKKFSSSLVYNLYVPKIITPRNFLYTYVTLLLLFLSGIYVGSIIENTKNRKNE